MTQPRPYIPPDTRRPGRARGPRPWMSARDGESEDDRIDRLHRTCYRCGHFDEDLDTLADHEDQCNGS